MQSTKVPREPILIEGEKIFPCLYVLPVYISTPVVPCQSYISGYATALDGDDCVFPHNIIVVNNVGYVNSPNPEFFAKISEEVS